MVNYEAIHINSGTDRSISGNDISSETIEYPETHPEDEGDTESEGTTVTGE